MDDDANATVEGRPEPGALLAAPRAADRVDPVGSAPLTTATAAPVEDSPSAELPGDEFGRPPRVFISYRRDDCSDVARRLAAQLRHDLSSEVFFDRDPLSIVAGDRWRERLTEEIGRSDVFVCVVGERWAGGDDGTDGEPPRPPRIGREDDVVRAEVEAALRAEPFPQVVVIFVDLDQSKEEQLRRAAADLFERFDELQRIAASGKEIRRRRSAPYQSLLVASWVALKDRIPDSILIVGDRQQMSDLDELVGDLRSAGRIDPEHFRQFRSGAYVVRRKVAKRRFAVLKKELPDAIIAVSPNEPTDEMKDRVRAVVSHPGVKSVGFVAVGGLAAGAGTALTQQAISWASTSGTTVTTSGTAAATAAVPAVSGVASLTVVGKVAAAGVLVAGVGGTAAAVDTVLPDPVEMEVAGSYGLEPVAEDERFYPLGEPPGIDVRFGPETVVSGENGGIDMVRRSVEVEAYGQVSDLGEITYPRRWSDVSDRVSGGWNTLGLASADLTLPVTGSGAAGFCYNTADPSHVVAGWAYVDDTVTFEVAIQAETGLSDDRGDLLGVRVSAWMANDAERTAIDRDWDFDTGTSQCEVEREATSAWQS